MQIISQKGLCFWQFYKKLRTIFCVVYLDGAFAVFLHNQFGHIQPKPRSVFISLCREVGFKNIFDNIRRDTTTIVCNFYNDVIFFLIGLNFYKSFPSVSFRG